MFTTCLLLFCQITIALLFIFSFSSKILTLADFAVAISDFKLLPRRWSKGAAVAFLSGELATIILAIIGGRLLSAGFLLATALLSLFSIALVLALRRKIKMSCNCFGPTEQHISGFDVVRNAILLLCTLVGLWTQQYPSQNLSVGEIMLLGLMSITFLVFVTNLDDIVETMRKPLAVNEGGRQG